MRCDSEALTHSPLAGQSKSVARAFAVDRMGSQGGASTAKLFSQIIASKPYSEMGSRSFLGILRLSNGYSVRAMEAAASLAVKLEGVFGIRA
jgi:hypothetical protein